MEISLPKDPSKICCICLKHIKDESQLMFFDTNQETENEIIFEQLSSLVPEFVQSNVILTKMVICVDCMADIESTLKFIKMCAYYELCSQSTTVCPPLGIFNRGDILIILPPAYLEIPRGYEFDEIDHLLSRRINNIHDIPNVPVDHDLRLLIANRNRPLIILYLRVTDSRDLASFYIAYSPPIFFPGRIRRGIVL